jgi:hypothetical protein
MIPCSTSAAPGPLPSLSPTAQSLPAATTAPANAGKAWRRRVLAMACTGVLAALFGFSAKPKPRGEPVAGIPALKRTDDGALERWASRRIQVVLDPSLERLSRNAPDAVVRSFGKWLGAAAELPDIEFVHARDSHAGPRRDGKNTVSYAPITLDGHGRELGITVTYSDPETGEILEADIVLNASHPLSMLDPDVEREERASCSGADAPCDEGYDFEGVVTHEVGHFFGLGEDRSNRRATMYFCQSRCEVHKRSVELSDLSPLEKLYTEDDVATSRAPGCGPGSSSPVD